MRTPKIEALSVSEAAKVLGVSRQALNDRIIYPVPGSLAFLWRRKHKNYLETS
jgi:hypothetical protein